MFLKMQSNDFIINFLNFVFGILKCLQAINNRIRDTKGHFRYLYISCRGSLQQQCLNEETDRQKDSLKNGILHKSVQN